MKVLKKMRALCHLQYIADKNYTSKREFLIKPSFWGANDLLLRRVRIGSPSSSKSNEVDAEIEISPTASAFPLKVEFSTKLEKIQLIKFSYNQNPYYTQSIQSMYIHSNSKLVVLPAFQFLQEASIRVTFFSYY